MSFPLQLLLVLVAMPVVAMATDTPPSGSAPPHPSVAVTGAATATIANDRMHAAMRAEAEAATAALAATEVNSKVAQATARAKAMPGVEIRTAGYSTWQMNEKGKPVRWRVVQSLSLEGSDFAQLAALLTRLQEEGMLLSGIHFTLRIDTRRRTEDGLTQQAIKVWQQRAEVAANALGYAGWRPGRVAVNTGDAGSRPEPMLRAQSAPAGGPMAPIAVEGGTTDITVTVSGDAVLDRPQAR